MGSVNLKAKVEPLSGYKEEVSPFDFSKGQMKRLSPAVGGRFFFDEKADLPLLRLGWRHELADGIEHNLVPKMNSVPVVPSFDRCAHIKPNSFNVQRFKSST